MQNLNPVENQEIETPDTGRISAYVANADEIDLTVLNCGRHGYSAAQTAACIGVCTATLTNWANDHPRFASVLARAKTLSQAWWEGRAMDGTAQNQIGSAVWTKSMSARFPQDYTDRQITDENKTVTVLFDKDDSEL